MAGAYCRYCDHRCFVERVLPDGRGLHMATCLEGAMHDLSVTGYTYLTARNPMEKEKKAMPERNEIIEGLKVWALGSYPSQTAVTFLAATNEPLTRVWVRETMHTFTGETMYWLDWEAFDEHGGGLSGGEYATWALARSLHTGELEENLWRIDPNRTAAFAAAIAGCRDNWR